MSHPVPAEKPNYHYFELSGNHYACGQEMGKGTTLRVVPLWKGRPLNLDFARACAGVVSEHHPGLIEEYRGYADAQRRPWEDVLPHFSLNHPAGEIGGCSTLLWRAENGHFFVARNYDFSARQHARHLIRCAPPAVQPTLGTNASLIAGRYDGVNAAGLFVSLHIVRTDDPTRVAPGVPFHLIPRILLERCTSTRQAAEWLCDLPIMHSFNYVLADAQGGLVVEVYPEAARVRAMEQGNTGEYLAVANHFEHPDMQHYLGARRTLTSRRRAERLGELWSRRHGDTWRWAPTLLADHEGPVCHHNPQMSTLWAVIADLTAHRIAYRFGSPCQGAFEELPWPCS